MSLTRLLMQDNEDLDETMLDGRYRSREQDFQRLKMELGNNEDVDLERILSRPNNQRQKLPIYEGQWNRRTTLGPHICNGIYYLIIRVSVLQSYLQK